MSLSTLSVLITAALVLGLWLSVHAGFRLGARHRRQNKDDAHLVAVQTAALGLLGLLLGFAFSGATSRFIEREVIIVNEANAIGTAYLRADLLDEPARSSLKRSLREYTQERVRLYDTTDSGQGDEISRRLAAAQAEMWATATAGIAGKPHLILPVLPPLNDVFDLLSTRNAASHRHLPLPVVGLLIACAVVSLGTIGYGCGLHAKSYLGTAGPLTLLIATALWVTIDLDYPRTGLIRIRGTPLLELRDSLKP